MPALVLAQGATIPTNDRVIAELQNKLASLENALRSQRKTLRDQAKALENLGGPAAGIYFIFF